MKGANRTLRSGVAIGASSLPGVLAIPVRPRELVIFAHRSENSRHSPRNVQWPPHSMIVGLRPCCSTCSRNMRRRIAATSSTSTCSPSASSRRSFGPVATREPSACRSACAASGPALGRELVRSLSAADTGRNGSKHPPVTAGPRLTRATHPHGEYQVDPLSLLFGNSPNAMALSSSKLCVPLSARSTSLSMILARSKSVSFTLLARSSSTTSSTASATVLETLGSSAIRCPLSLAAGSMIHRASINSSVMAYPSALRYSPYRTPSHT